MYNNDEGIENTAVGFDALRSTVAASGNTAVGYQAATGVQRSNLEAPWADYNTAVGHNSLVMCQNGANNTAIGASALLVTFEGDNNTALGTRAGQTNTSGDNNTYIGYETVGSGIANTNEMVIGYQAVGLGSNTTVINNASTTATTLYGKFTTTGVIAPQQAVTASAPTYSLGAMYFDTTLNKLRVGGATVWETLQKVITVSTTAPSSPAVNDLWYDTN
jgi:hypothetical protein